MTTTMDSSVPGAADPDPDPQPRTVGVEEEFLLVDPERAEVTAAAPRVLAREPGNGRHGEVEAELTREQVETGSAPHRDLSRLRASLAGLRRAAAEAARSEGVALAAVATSPTAARPTVTQDRRYERMREVFRLTAREQLTCGCHVHVAVASRDEGVGALDRIRPWLPALLALSVNSPYYQAQDTGYASFRTQVWQRWPTAGPTGTFGSAAAYDRVVEELMATGAALDGGMIYFDARLSRHYPTLEIRVADVCLDVDDAVLVAALARALVTTAAADWATGRPAPDPRPEILRAAQWVSSRFGITGDLVDVTAVERVPARALLDRLVAHVRPALDAAGDTEAVAELLDGVFGRGTGADRQRRAFRRRDRLSDVVDLVVRETLPY